MNKFNKAAPVAVLLDKVRIANAMAPTSECKHVIGVSEDL